MKIWLQSNCFISAIQDVSKAVFYFRRDVKSSQEYFIYSSTSMIAEIGGYVGLLGLNLIDPLIWNNKIKENMLPFSFGLSLIVLTMHGDLLN